jgi:hypothetical protein
MTQSYRDMGGNVYPYPVFLSVVTSHVWGKDAVSISSRD